MKQILIIKQATGHILAAGRFPHSEKSFFSFSRSEVSFPPVSLKLEEQVRSWAAPSSRAATLTGSKLVIRVFLFLLSANMFLQRNVCPSHANGLHLTFDCTAFVFVWLHWDVLACHLSLNDTFLLMNHCSITWLSLHCSVYKWLSFIADFSFFVLETMTPPGAACKIQVWLTPQWYFSFYKTHFHHDDDDSIKALEMTLVL